MYNINVMSFNDFPNTLDCLKTFKKRSIVKMVNRTGIESSCKRVGIFKITNHMIITIQLFYCILQKNLGTSKTQVINAMKYDGFLHGSIGPDYWRTPNIKMGRNSTIQVVNSLPICYIINIVSFFLDKTQQFQGR